jgi:hypothetical protein
MAKARVFVDPRKKARFAAKHPELQQKYTRKRAHAAHIKREHGLDRADYEYVLRVQGGRCAICRRRPEDLNQTHLAIDHCHQSGRTRGLLCRDCNWMLGRIKEDPLTARALVAYIENRCVVGKN